MIACSELRARHLLRRLQRMCCQHRQSLCGQLAESGHLRQCDQLEFSDEQRWTLCGLHFLRHQFSQPAVKRPRHGLFGQNRLLTKCLGVFICLEAKCTRRSISFVWFVKIVIIPSPTGNKSRTNREQIGNKLPKNSSDSGRPTHT